jgi:adenylate cyclase
MAQQILVAREPELERLDGFLDQALAGQGRVCFVTGEAGSGKTSLVTEFAGRALEERQDLVVSVGQSDAQTGVGDPYLPFREVLAQLTGDVEAKLAQGAITEENASRLRKLLVLSGQALVEVGPDLIGIFVPGAGLATRVGAFMAEKVGWLDRLEGLASRRREDAGVGGPGIEQSNIFEQYTNVLTRLAEKRPLLVVLDDLQWADAASIGLLFRLGRRIDGSRILLVGTYRPEEVALGRAGERHPLEKVLAEFKRYYGDLSVDLNRAKEEGGRHFVDAFLEVEPNRLGEGFRQALYHHTGGHPLFTIELLRDMQERGDLVQDGAGMWTEGLALDWAGLPARVEGVIEERVGRLEEELREALTVGSVEGEDFTVEVVAGVQEVSARGLVRRLTGELEKRHRLVRAQGVRRLDSSGQRLSLFRFQHNLFQKYLYNELGEAERAYLHEDVGDVLEALYGDQADGIAVQLARHFEEAGIFDKATTYLRRAGEQAAERYANDEAVTYLSRALDLIPASDTAGRYALLLAREEVYDVQGAREAQVQDLAALSELVASLDDPGKQAQVALRRSNHAEVTGDFAQSIAEAKAAVALAGAAQDARSEAAGHLQWGRTLWRQGEYEPARTQLERALDLAGSGRLPQLEADSLRNLGVVAQEQGNFDDAKAYYERSLRIAHQIGNRRSEGQNLNNLGNIAKFRGDPSGARTCYEQALHIFREIGDRFQQVIALNNLGCLLDERGDYAAATACYEQVLGMSREIGDRESVGIALNNLGSVCHNQGDFARAQAYYQQALRIYREIGKRWEESLTLKNLGLLLCHLGDLEAARRTSQQALAIARDLGARFLQGYILTDLGHTLAALKDLAQAAEAYRQSLHLRRESGEHHLAMEPLAGLAGLALAREDLAGAQAHVEEILAFLETHSLDGTEEPFRAYLTCYRVLRANHDPRAGDILSTAYHQLQARATNIRDEEGRRLFLENIAAHREIVAEWEARQGTGESQEGA